MQIPILVTIAPDPVSLNSVNRKIYFSDGSVIKSPPANAGDASPILGQEDPLEKKIATHSSILAWENPWTEDCNPWSSERVRHDLVTT